MSDIFKMKKYLKTIHNFETFYKKFAQKYEKVQNCYKISNFC